MEGLIGSLNKEKWQEVSVAEKTGKYVEYHVNRMHKQLDPTSFAFMVETDEDSETKTVVLEHATGDPIKNISLCEFKLSEDGTKVVGMDLDGDVVVLK